MIRFKVELTGEQYSFLFDTLRKIGNGFPLPSYSYEMEVARSVYEAMIGHEPPEGWGPKRPSIYSVQTLGFIPFFTLIPSRRRCPIEQSDWRHWVRDNFSWAMYRCRVGNGHWFFDFRPCRCDKEAMTQYADH